MTRGPFETLQDALDDNPYHWENQSEYDEESNHSEDIMCHVAYLVDGYLCISTHDRGSADDEMREQGITEYDGPFLPWERMRETT